MPISTVQFPSNWELSATRAVTVVRTLSEQYGVQADHLTAVGHADSRSLTDNLTPENRAKNRRVEIVVQERKPTPQPIETSEPRTALEMFGASQEGVKRETSSLPDQIPLALRFPPRRLVHGSGRTKYRFQRSRNTRIVPITNPSARSQHRIKRDYENRLQAL